MSRPTLAPCVLAYMLCLGSPTCHFASFLKFVSMFPSDTDETPLSEGSPTPEPNYLATSRPSSQLLGRLKKELARKGLEGEIKFSSSVNLQSVVDILAEGGMMTSFRSSPLLYCHRSS